MGEYREPTKMVLYRLFTLYRIFTTFRNERRREKKFCVKFWITQRPDHQRILYQRNFGSFHASWKLGEMKTSDMISRNSLSVSNWKCFLLCDVNATWRHYTKNQSGTASQKTFMLSIPGIETILGWNHPITLYAEKSLAGFYLDLEQFPTQRQRSSICGLSESGTMYSVLLILKPSVVRRILRNYLLKCKKLKKLIQK